MNTLQRKEPTKQEELPAMTGPGVGQVNDKEIDDAIDAYVLARDQQLELKRLATDAEDVVKGLLREKVKPDPDGVIIYRHEHLTATLYKKEKLKVKGRRKSKNDNGAEE